MIVSIGADHAGFIYKEPIKEHLAKKGIQVLDEGTNSDQATDYPDYAFKVGNRVKNQQADLGILICGTGVGMSIAANKVEGIRAALLETEFTAESSKTHNHANVITFGSRVNTIDEVLKFIDIFMNAKESDAIRHVGRVEKINKYEEKKWEK
ncbi:MAG: ribose 5-phosphate isomerase B [Bacilli bacterium]|nr:ribose 5-phosphate isomerase B [Bacilli bacterium]MBN2876648.1 ribose 5-phosphate isomerase B [Bacilli bacterium]